MNKYVSCFIVAGLFFSACLSSYADYYVQRYETGAETPSFEEGEYYVKTPEDFDGNESNEGYNTEINYNYYSPYYPYMYYPSGYGIYGTSFGINIGGGGVRPGPKPPGPNPKPPSPSPSPAPTPVPQQNAPGSQIQKWYSGTNHLRPPML